MKQRKNMDILNLAYKVLTSAYHDLFNKDDYLMLSYIKQSINRGWKILIDKNIIKEINCNSLCMTMSILNSTLGQRKKVRTIKYCSEIILGIYFLFG